MLWIGLFLGVVIPVILIIIGMENMDTMSDGAKKSIIAFIGLFVIVGVILVGVGVNKTFSNAVYAEVVEVEKEILEVTVGKYVENSGVDETLVLFEGDGESFILVNIEALEPKNLKVGEKGLLIVSKNKARYKEYTYSLGNYKEYTVADSFKFIAETDMVKD